LPLVLASTRMYCSFAAMQMVIGMCGARCVGEEGKCRLTVSEACARVVSSMPHSETLEDW